MRPFAPNLVYKIGRVSLLIGLGLVPVAARAQDAQVPAPTPGNPAPAVPAVPAPEAPAPLSETGAVPVPAPAPSWTDRVDELDQRTRILERKQELAQEAAAAAAAAPKPPGPTFQADENGFSISSADKQYQVRFKGLLQFDGRRFFDDQTLANSDTFVLRRIRPILDGTLLGLVDFRFSPDFGNNTTAILDAYIDTHPRPWLRLRVGKFKAPYGLERLQADQDVTFIERALDQNLTPQREIGLQLWGDIAGGIVRYEAGVYNGNPDNGLNDIDSDHAKSFGGRLFVQPFNTDALRAFGRLGVGIAASTGNEKGSSALTAGAASNTWLGSFKSAGQNTIFSYITNTTDLTQTVIALARHTRINPQLYYYNGPFGLLAELVKEYQEVAKGTTTGGFIDTGAFNNTAGHVTASVVIGGDATYEGVKPHHPLDLSAGTYGAVELAARYNRLDIDSAAFTGATGADLTKSVSRAQGFGLALNWQLSRNIKASGNYEQTYFVGGAAKGADRNTEKVLIGRYQISF
jgi:phosphate-selective porin OprO and OprP